MCYPLRKAVLTTTETAYRCKYRCPNLFSLIFLHKTDPSLLSRTVWLSDWRFITLFRWAYLASKQTSQCFQTAWILLRQYKTAWQSAYRFFGDWGAWTETITGYFDEQNTSTWLTYWILYFTQTVYGWRVQIWQSLLLAVIWRIIKLLTAYALL